MVFTALRGATLVFLAAHVGALQTNVEARDAAPFALQGCYTSTPVTSRTLAGASFTSSNMTVDSCIAFCTAGGANFAGVEYSSECCSFSPRSALAPLDFGDCRLRLRAAGLRTLSSAGNCDMPCSGNATEVCGGANFVDLYWNGVLPVVPQQVGSWNTMAASPIAFLQGLCPHEETIPGGVTVESCTSACKANGFGVAGLEYGLECWCSNSLPTSSSSSDNDCHTACAANTTEFCGGLSKLSVYEDSTDEICLAYHDGDRLQSCSGVFHPSHDGPYLVHTFGDSPTFVTTEFPPTAVGDYCIMSNPVLGSAGSETLGINGRNDLFALCPNSTAGGRVDVVFNPIPNNPHYTLATANRFISSSRMSKLQVLI
ncbi:hypothetical protein B0H11DRAFT_2359542 [Mycena galericulata]|nr:hypothetical protein B0H11DRAFT_2359542 [Mycena galericulata]